MRVAINGGTYDTDVIPHEASKFIPVVGNHNFFISIRDAAGVPVGERGWRAGRLSEDVSDGAFRENNAFQ